MMEILMQVISLKNLEDFTRRKIVILQNLIVFMYSRKN